MELAEDLRILHQPTRLRIMAVICRFRDVGFADVRDHLGLTDGNMGSHASHLERAGLIEARRSLGRTGIVVRYRPTKEGDRRVDKYREWVEAALRG